MRSGDLLEEKEGLLRIRRRAGCFECFKKDKRGSGLSIGQSGV
jgi:hypothetical protein